MHYIIIYSNAFRSIQSVTERTARMQAKSTTIDKAQDLLEAYNAAKMMKEEDSAAMIADLRYRAGRSLLKAVRAGDISECRELLAIEGVDVNVKDCPNDPNRGRTPLLLACKKGNFDIVKLLVFNGANIHDGKGSNGWGCLMFACLKGNLSLVEYLVSLGADVNETSDLGYTCLMTASTRGYLDIVEFLLAVGASTHLITEGGFTCFICARHDLRIRVLYRLRKWPTTMAIIILQKLNLIYIIDSESVIDLHQYLGRPDDLMADNEEEYRKDKDGYVLDPFSS